MTLEWVTDVEGLYYFEDGVAIFKGDTTDVLKRLPVGCADVEVFSPPYNVDVPYDGLSDNRPWREYWSDVDRWAANLAVALQVNGRCWTNIAPVVQEAPGGAGRNGHELGRAAKSRQSLLAGWAQRLEAAGLQPADVIAWTSQRGSGTAWGSYQRPSAPNIRGDWEAILVHFKGEWARIPPAGLEKWNDTHGDWPKLVSNVWDLQPERRNGHPAPYPVQLAERCIRLSTWPGEVVLDPFCGQGSTLVAAKRLGRLGLGIEQSEKYCRLAVDELRATSVLTMPAPEPKPPTPTQGAFAE